MVRRRNPTKSIQVTGISYKTYLSVTESEKVDYEQIKSMKASYKYAKAMTIKRV